MGALMLVVDGPRPEQLVFRADGTPLLEQKQGVTLNRESVRYKDLAGNDVPAEEDVRELNFTFLDRARPPGRGEPPESIGPIFSDGRNQPTYWTLERQPQTGLAYFVGYSTTTNLRIGCLGRNGFTSDEPPPGDCLPLDTRADGVMSHIACSASAWEGSMLSGQFPQRSSLPSEASAFSETWVYLAGTDHHLYQVDLRKRAVRAVLERPKIASIAYHDAALANDRTEKSLVVRTASELLLLDDKMEVRRTYKLPAEIADRSFSWAEISPGHAVAYWLDVMHVPQGTSVDRIVWFDTSGTVARRETATLHTAELGSLRFVAACPCPLVMGATVLVFAPATLIEQRRAADWTEALQMAREELGPAWLAVQIVAVALAALCWWRERRYASPGAEQIVWPLVVLIGGVPAWLGYRFSRRWPVLERCPSCGASVPRDCAECARCRREFPRPTIAGTEIFADHEREALAVA
jgi:hypothetical protein